MKEHTLVLQENEFRLFQAIQRIETPPKRKDVLIENFIQQIEAFINSESLSAKDIMLLPEQERQLILAEQFQEAEQLYEENPDIIVPDVDSPIEY